MKRLLLLACCTAAFANHAGAAEYRIDARHTQVRFTYSHLGFSNISGRLTEVTGTFDFDPAKPTASRIDVQVPIASLSTGVPKLDEHMKSEQMFDAARFPTAAFRSTGVTVAGEGKLQVAGDLTIHGVTKPVVLDVTINKVGEHPFSKAPMAGFDATATIRRSDFGVNFMAPMVPDAVRLDITLEAQGAAPAPAAQ